MLVHPRYFEGVIRLYYRYPGILIYEYLFIPQHGACQWKHGRVSGILETVVGDHLEARERHPASPDIAFLELLLGRSRVGGVQECGDQAEMLGRCPRMK
jgi:hypothetical protein